MRGPSQTRYVLIGTHESTSQNTQFTPIEASCRAQEDLPITGIYFEIVKSFRIGVERVEYDQRGPPRRLPVVPMVPGDLPKVLHIPDRRELLLHWDMQEVRLSRGGLYMEPRQREKGGSVE
jgi:hypothetical protein